MSNADNEVVNKREILITPEDVASLDFWNHFKIPMMKGLQEAGDAFVKDATFENQEQFKYCLCKAISETDHPALKESMFLMVSEAAKEVTYAMQFDRDLEKALSQDGDTNQDG